MIWFAILSEQFLCRVVCLKKKAESDSTVFQFVKILSLSFLFRRIFAEIMANISTFKQNNSVTLSYSTFPQLTIC